MAELDESNPPHQEETLNDKVSNVLLRHYRPYPNPTGDDAINLTTQEVYAEFKKVFPFETFTPELIYAALELNGFHTYRIGTSIAWCMVGV